MSYLQRTYLKKTSITKLSKKVSDHYTGSVTETLSIPEGSQLDSNNTSAVLQNFKLDFGNNTDHNVRIIQAGVTSVSVKGADVTVNVQAELADNSGHYANNNDIELDVLIIATVNL